MTLIQQLNGALLMASLVAMVAMIAWEITIWLLADRRPSQRPPHRPHNLATALMAGRAVR